MKPVSRRATIARVRRHLYAALSATDSAIMQDPAYGWSDTLAFLREAEEALAKAKQAIATPTTT